MSCGENDIEGCIRRFNDALKSPKQLARIQEYIRKTIMGYTKEEQDEFAADAHVDQDVWEAILKGKRKYTPINIVAKKAGIYFVLDEEHQFHMLSQVYISQDEMIEMCEKLQL